MNPHQLQTETIFERARRLTNARERRAYLEVACAGDETLRQDVESLVTAYERCGSFLKTPVVMGPPQLLLPGPGFVLLVPAPGLCASAVLGGRAQEVAALGF